MKRARFHRSGRETVNKRDQIATRVRVQCVAIGSNGKGIKGNITKSLSIDKQRVSTVFSALEKLLFDE